MDSETLKRLKKATAPRIKTGTCSHCGRDIFNKRANAKFCSAKCRTASCRKALPAPHIREIENLKALVQQQHAEIENLKALLQQLQEKTGHSQALVQQMGDHHYQDLAAECRRAKVARREEVARRKAAQYARRR
jgi:hypothetical protein